MKVSYRWLQEYVKTSLPPVELGERFRMTSSETESVTDWSLRFEHMVVGRVISLSRHPNADRLAIAQIDIGEQSIQIVSGAPNLEQNQTVAVALPGARLLSMKGEPITIQETILRGQPSAGMLCAPEELGLPISSEGIMVLEASLKAGTPLAIALQLDDTVLDLEITPNRPDLLSYRGLAREVGTFEKKRLTEPPLSILEEWGELSPIPINITIEDSRLCPRYSAICLDGITNGPSPWWMQARLILSGIRPVSAVVDVANYVMLEYGQPLHAFDLDYLEKVGGKLQVRGARKNEQLSLLGGSSVTLEEGDIVIAGGETAVALAGIMGTSASGVKAQTTRILLESATFQGAQIRRTSLRLGVRSESSSRFEKGLDPEQTITALKRAAYLLQAVTGARVCNEPIDIRSRIKAERPRIHLSFSQIQQLLGVHISAAEAKGILQRLGFQLPSLTKSSFETVPPSWRADVTLPEDVMEELARIWGYDRIPETLPSGQIVSPKPNQHFEEAYTIRQALSALGLHECLHLSFVSEAELRLVGFTPSDAIHLTYALSKETEYLAPTHAIRMLENIATTNVRETELGLFEIGHLFHPPAQENEQLSLLLRTEQPAEHLYRQVKSILERVGMVAHRGKPAYKESPDQPPFLEEETILQVSYQDKAIGYLGMVRPTVIRTLKLRNAQNILFASLDLDAFLQLPARNRIYQPSSAFPGINRDLTLVVASDLPVGQVAELFSKEINPAITANWEIRGTYTGKNLPPDTKSVTLHFEYNAFDRTLEDAEVNADQQRLVAQSQTHLSAQVI